MPFYGAGRPAGGKHARLIPCDDHKPVQHRDGKPPWCKACGLTVDGTVPESRFPKKP